MFKTKRLVITALHVALSLLLPMAFHAIPNAGRVFLPMHIPVLLCGLACGFSCGLACGVCAPLLSCLLTGMPPVAMLPAMLCELGVYGAVSALLMRRIRVGGAAARTYLALGGAMLAGRAVSGALNALIFRAGEYSLQMWLAASFVTALPGIAIQLVLIPAILLALHKARVVETTAG